jgi:hypothetical protein
MTASMLLRTLREPPRVEAHFADVELGGELSDLVDGVEHSTITVVDLNTHMQTLVDPDDGRCAAFASDVDADPDVLAGGEGRLPDVGLPRAGWQPGALGPTHWFAW